MSYPAAIIYMLQDWTPSSVIRFLYRQYVYLESFLYILGMEFCLVKLLPPPIAWFAILTHVVSVVLVLLREHIHGSSSTSGLSELSQSSDITPIEALDHDCIQQIVERVRNSVDFLACRGVCRLWRRASNYSVHWDRGTPPPCLMLSRKPHHGSGRDTRRCFSPFTGRAFELKLPTAARRSIFISGSPHGCLLTVDPELRVHLLNPVSKVCISDLPPLNAIENLQLARGNQQFPMICKLFVFAINNDDSEERTINFLLMAIMDPENRYLAFTFRPGNGDHHQSWVLVSGPEASLFRDVAHFQGQFYALRGNGSVVRLDFNEQHSATTQFIADHPAREFVGYDPGSATTARVYLVASWESLFGVFRYSGEDDNGQERTREFVVYTFIFERLEWGLVWSLGEKAFFVGNGNSWSINTPVDGVNYCKRDSVYFSDDMINGSGFDHGVYSLETWEVAPLESGDNHFMPDSHPLTTTWLLLKV